MNKFGSSTLIGALVALILIVGLGFNACQTVPAGHVAVATLFGDVKEKSYEPGLHFPVNPLYRWNEYDARQKTHMETAEVPTQDQLTTAFDVSVQWRVNQSMAGDILRDTGTFEDLITVHLVPTLRSLLREQGKSVAQAQMFFQQEVQESLQVSLQASLEDALASKGIIVDAVLLRDMRLPNSIMQRVEERKAAEQQAEQAIVELERTRTEELKAVARAEAEQKAAELEALMIRTLAEARAFEIQTLNEAIASNPSYIQLEALKTLQAMSENPASQIYFLNSDSQMPLPLMNVGAIGRD